MQTSAVAMIPAAEYRDRRGRAARLAQDRGLDALIVWGRGGTLDSFSDVYYFTAHYSPMVWVPPLPGLLTGCEHACVVISDDGTGVLFVSDFCSEEVQADEVRSGWDLAAAVASHLSELTGGESSVGVVGQEVLPFGVADQIRSTLPRLRLEPADDISSKLRLQLSDAEVAMLRRAGEVGAQIYEELVAHVVPGATEGEAIGAAWALASQIPGCAHWNFLSASGPDAGAIVKHSLPPWRPDRRYEAGDTVHADCYGYVSGYCYDLARTVFAGGPQTPGQERVAAATAEAVQEASQALRPGVTSSALREAMSRALEARSLTALSGSFGHAIGAGFFRPYLLPAGPDLDRPLEPPFGFSLEVLATDGRDNYAYYEDNYVVLTDETICVTRVEPLAA
jgi:Xaa-Pro aminopeptidase